MTDHHSSLPDSVTELLSQFQVYSRARVQFLEQLNLPKSCRDPLAEFSEILVGQILNATLADSRVQKDYDLTRPDGQFVQVKYLSNSSKVWVNEHHIHFPDTVAEYALVVFTSLQVEAILVFQKETLGQVCTLLAKTHPNQDQSLQLTRRNYETILSAESAFEKLGVRVYRFESV